MERAIAVKKLRKLLGDKFGYRVDDKAPSREERADAQAKLGPANEERKLLAEKRDARRNAVLAADAEYQSLCTEYKTAAEKVQRFGSLARRYKITVGKTVLGFAFSVMAEGDSWEEVIEKLAKEKQTA